MNSRSALIIRAVGLVVLSALAASPATAALAIRTWVSGVGDDLNPCSRTAPCKTFAGAIPKTAAGGEIDALDPGEYGGTAGSRAVVEITKALTIDGGAGTATILVPSGNGVLINAGSDDTVVLRNLSIHPSSAAFDGIRVEGGRNALIEHCAVSGFSNGIGFLPVGPMSLTVADTTVENNLNGMSVGTFGAYFARLTATHVRFDGNFTGIFMRDNALVFVSDSSASNNIDGFVARSDGGAAELDLENVSSSNNSNAGAVVFNPGAVIRLSNTSIEHNGGPGVVPIGGGLILSFGNNKFSGNAMGDGTINGPLVPK